MWFLLPSAVHSLQRRSWTTSETQGNRRTDNALLYKLYETRKKRNIQENVIYLVSLFIAICTLDYCFDVCSIERKLSIQCVSCSLDVLFIYCTAVVVGQTKHPLSHCGNRMEYNQK